MTDFRLPPPQQEAPQPGQVPLSLAQPCPMSVNVSPVYGAQAPDGQAKVVLRVESVTGSHMIFLDPEQAKQIGSVLGQVAAQVTGGLVIPTPT